MNILSLFSGTKSITKELTEHNVISVDIDNTFSPTHNVDIMKFNYKQYDKDYFNIIFASPVCVWYSHLQYGWLNRERKVDGIKMLFTREILEKKMKESDKLVDKVYEIIEYFNVPYFIENPYTSRLKDRKCMKAPYQNSCSYCKYDFPYQKRTIIFSNMKLSLLNCKKDCGKMLGNLHYNNIGKSKNSTRYAKLKQKGIKNYGKTFNLHERWRIPPKLIRHIIKLINS